MEKTDWPKRGGTGALCHLARGGVLDCLGAFPKIHAQALKLHDIGEPDN